MKISQENAADLVEVWRGPLLESQHRGHIVVCDGSGQIVQAWGNPEAVIFPRSSAKIIQALPLIETGAADSFGLTEAQIAFACASHRGAQIHLDAARRWLSDLGLTDDALICGPQVPDDLPMRDGLIRDGETPCRAHNNCSGKHCGFLTVSQHLNAGFDYVALDHPLQVACKAAVEETCQETSPGYGVDGCSAPNFATTVAGLAGAMGRFASARGRSDARAQAMVRLTDAMAARPELVAGEGGADTAFMRAMDGKVVVKTGAEGVYVAIIPELQLGVALKIADGATRGAECAIAAVLVKLGVLNPAHPTAKHYMAPPIQNWDGLITGQIRPAATLQ